MINHKSLKELKTWFSRYVDSFLQTCEKQKKKIEMKKAHCHRTEKEIFHLAKKMGLAGDRIILARIIGLLHDIGRFEQYCRYLDFNQRRKEDHGLSGANLLREKAVLSFLPDKDQAIVYKAVQSHNQINIPHDVSEEELLFIKLLRDADKLDIWHFVTTYCYNKPGFKRMLNPDFNSSDLKLPDKYNISEKVFEQLLKGKIIRFEDLTCLNDLKCMQLSWIYELYFTFSLQKVFKRQYIHKICSVIKAEKVKVKIIKNSLKMHLKKVFTL
jgi:hypothetical protein